MYTTNNCVRQLGGVVICFCAASIKPIFGQMLRFIPDMLYCMHFIVALSFKDMCLVFKNRI